MRPGSGLVLALAFAAALAVGAPSSALAQSPAEIQIARQLAGEALTAYKAGEYPKALGLFDQARAIYPSAQILRMLGYTQLALEKWEKAEGALEAALASKVSPLSADDEKDVRAQLDKALAHFATVSVRSKVAGATLAVDGGEARRLPLDKPLRLLEGKHTFVVRAEAHADAKVERDLAGGKTVEIDLEPVPADKPLPAPSPAPPPAPPPAKKPLIPHQRAIGFAAAGAGVAVGGAALAVALVGLNLKGQVEDDVAIHEKFYGENCSKGDPRLCAFDVAVINHQADQADLARNWSIGLAAGAGVLFATGVVLVVAAPRDKAPAPAVGHVACSFGSGVSCRTSF